MRKNKNTSKIILATIVALLAIIISYGLFKNMDNQLSQKQAMIDVMQKTGAQDRSEVYAYAVALDDMKAGEIVADDDVDFKNFEIKNPDAYENRSDIVNKVLLKDISIGETFTSAHIAKISSDTLGLREGYRAVTVPGETFQGKSESMKPGSLVDIYSTDSENSWVLEDVRIVGFEGSKLTDTNITNATAITFEVSSEEISDFISTVSKGKLMLVARNASEKRPVHKKAKRAVKPSYSASSIPSLPNLPASVPITNLSGLPSPIQPEASSQAVEVIEANVKSKVTFD